VCNSLEVAALRKGQQAHSHRKGSGSVQRNGRPRTTTIEAKSGYGLSTVSEIKIAGSHPRRCEQWPWTDVPTLVGRTLVPDEFKDTR